MELIYESDDEVISNYDSVESEKNMTIGQMEHIIQVEVFGKILIFITKNMFIKDVKYSILLLGLEN